MGTAEHGPDDDALDPDEPETPTWLPLLGIALFLIAALLFIATRGDDEQAAPAGGATAEPAEPAEPAEEAAEPEH